MPDVNPTDETAFLERDATAVRQTPPTIRRASDAPFTPDVVRAPRRRIAMPKQTVLGALVLER